MSGESGPKSHSLWGGRFDSGLAPEMEALNRSLDTDWRLWPHDIRGSRAWARGLARAGILSADEAALIDGGLRRVADQLAALDGPDSLPDEDIHSVVERLLTEEIGSVAGKLHTGRSRNDQVATDFRMWGMAAAESACADLAALVQSIAAKARAATGVIMPGYTHLQQAQPVPAAHWLLSRAWPLVRDIEHFRAVKRECASLPLGSGAIAGCPFDVDREQLAADLGFARVCDNSTDAVSDRDWAAKLLFAAALAGVHLSQFAEDLVVFSSAEFGFVRIGGGFVTGSSLMPQKRNPDVAELVRGKSGRMVGNLTALLTVLKGMPTGYNRDLQEDKEAVFDSMDTLAVALPAMTGAVGGLEIARARVSSALGAELYATDLAEYLVRRGVPFRESHHAVGALVRKAENSGRALDQLAPEEFRAVHPAFGEDVVSVFDPVASVESRSVRGATASAAVRDQLDRLDQALQALVGVRSPAEN